MKNEETIFLRTFHDGFLEIKKHKNDEYIFAVFQDEGDQKYLRLDCNYDALLEIFQALQVEIERVKIEHQEQTGEHESNKI